MRRIAASQGKSLLSFFFFHDTATTQIYTLSLHDALPIYLRHSRDRGGQAPGRSPHPVAREEADGEGAEGVLPQREDEGDSEGTGPQGRQGQRGRSEEHTSELQSRLHLVCRLLLEKKKKKQ